MDYKYITRFDANALEVAANNSLAALVDKALKHEIKASLDELKSLTSSEFNPEMDSDLLYIASPLVLVGKCNLNGDCLDKQGAIAKHKTFVKKLLDIEHKRDKIVGNIFAAVLTEVDTNRILTEEEAMQKDLFNISYAAYIWKVANPKLAQFVSMASKEDSQFYNQVSSSFEVGFDEYKIAVGSTTLSLAKILSVEEQVGYEKFLKANGGKGVDDEGNPVYRVLAYDWCGRGAGLVAKPASQVKGVITIEKMMENVPEVEEKKESSEDDAPQNAAAQLIKKLKEKDIELEKKVEDLRKSIELVINKSAEKNDIKVSGANILEKNNIQSKNDGVITNTAKPMKITKLEDIAANKGELFKNESYAADIAQLIADETAKISERYVAKLKESEDAAKFLAEAKAQAETKAAELQAKTEELSSKVQELAAKLNEIEEAKAAEIAERLFNERMTGLDAEFELDEESRGFVAADIKGMNDEQFSSYAKKAKALFKKKMMKKEECKEDAKAKELDAKDAVAAATDEKQTGLPNNVVPAETLADRMKKAFGAENVKIDGKEVVASKKE